MGNCCMRPETRDWAGEDWGSVTSKHRRRSKSKVFDETRELNARSAEKESVLRSASSDSNGRVTIRISKKELHELLMKGSIENQTQKKDEGALMSAEQVLVRLMNGGHHKHHRPWRPVLQTIPEID